MNLKDFAKTCWSRNKEQLRRLLHKEVTNRNKNRETLYLLTLHAENEEEYIRRVALCSQRIEEADSFIEVIRLIKEKKKWA